MSDPVQRAGRASTPGPVLLAAAATLLVALNLRVPTTALGPLLPTLLAETGHGETFLSLLTTIPLALTLVIAPWAPRWAARFGRDRVVAWVMVGVALGRRCSTSSLFRWRCLHRSCCVVDEGDSWLWSPR